MLRIAVRAVRRVEILDTLLGIDVILKHLIYCIAMYMFTVSLLASLMRASKGFGECDVGIPERSLMSLDIRTGVSGIFYDDFWSLMEVEINVIEIFGCMERCSVIEMRLNMAPDSGHLPFSGVHFCSIWADLWQ